MPNKSIILIPARLDSTRLEKKAIADIAGLPMVIHVAKQALKSKITTIAIASGDSEIIEIAAKHNIKAIKTKQIHNCGTNRIYEALSLLKNSDYEYIINLQGDLPNINPKLLDTVLETLKESEADIATLGCLIETEKEQNNPNIVKIIASDVGYKAPILKALYFTRAVAPYGTGDLYKHIGLYAYKKAALAKFIALPPSKLEQRESLEQLRALENDMSIAVSLVDEYPLSVDTKEDLAYVKNIFQKI